MSDDLSGGVVSDPTDHVAGLKGGETSTMWSPSAPANGSPILSKSRPARQPVPEQHRYRPQIRQNGSALKM
jgi:hypothetical protein